MEKACSRQRKAVSVMADVNASKMCMCGKRFVLSKQEPQKLAVGVSGRITVKKELWQYNLRSLNLTEKRKLQVGWVCVCVCVCVCVYLFKT